MSKKRKFKHISNENSDDSDDESYVLVESIENHIYFYCNVSQKSIFELIKAIHALNNRILSYSVVIGQKPHEIFLHINSDGGEIFAALAAVDHIIASKVPITTIIEGCAASAATLLSIVGKKRQIRKHASMLIHQLSSGLWGKMAEMEDEINNCRYLEKITMKMYKKYSDLTDAKLSKCLKKDIWWSAKTCLKYKLVDEII